MVIKKSAASQGNIRLCQTSGKVLRMESEWQVQKKELGADRLAAGGPRRGKKTLKRLDHLSLTSAVEEADYFIQGVLTYIKIGHKR